MSAFTFLLGTVLGVAVGLRWKHRRFLAERSARRVLDERMDAYRRADARTDLDVVGPVTGEHPAVELYDRDAEDNSMVGDGFGSQWAKCGPGCDLEVVRPGKVQCSCEDDTSTSLPRSLPDGRYGKAGGRRLG